MPVRARLPRTSISEVNKLAFSEFWQVAPLCARVTRRTRRAPHTASERTCVLTAEKEGDPTSRWSPCNNPYVMPSPTIGPTPSPSSTNEPAVIGDVRADCFDSVWCALEPSMWAGLGAIGAVVVATMNLRIDYVARRDQRVSALISHFMSTEVTAARDLLTRRESRFHDARTRHAAFVLLWAIERVGADLGALRPSWATRLGYKFGVRPRQASGVDVLYGNLARVTRCLNRYFHSDASNSYYVGSVGTANRVIELLPDWHRVASQPAARYIPRLELSPSPHADYRHRAIYKLVAPDNSFIPPRGTGTSNALQRWQRTLRRARSKKPFEEG
jgi:hypothetical protein